MADSRFFHNAGSRTLDALAALTGATLAGAPADGARLFHDVAPLDRAGEQDVSFLDNIKYIESFAASEAGCCFVRAKFADKAPPGMVLLVTEQPYSAYTLAAQAFYPLPPVAAAISSLASISITAHIGQGSRIDAGAVIGDNVTIGERCHIGANTVIDSGTQIGDDCRIGALCSISHTLMGNRVTLHRGIHIGQDGFGFAPTPRGLLKVPQLGRVVIGDEVEIGAGTCIDRGAGPDTVIGMGSKIDNLVQIGHNVQLGKYVIITGQCGISGSTQIGDGAMIGAQAGLAGHLRIGAGAKLAARSGVMADIAPGDTYGGTPAVPVRDWHRQTVALAKLVKKKEE
jgi:UDP-3-O-[3-hydroxymyristoyl] glucosamine N-acyltransferase